MKHIPGEIDHTCIMMSSIAGLTPQMVGFNGSKKFHRISFFVDDRSDFTFVHRQTSTLEEEIIQAKHAYEADLWQFGDKSKTLPHRQRHLSCCKISRGNRF